MRAGVAQSIRRFPATWWPQAPRARPLGAPAHSTDGCCRRLFGSCSGTVSSCRRASALRWRRLSSRTVARFFSWVWDPDLNFGEAYMFGAVEIHGDLVAHARGDVPACGAKPRPWWLWQASNDVRAAKENVHHHYDLGNDFYRLWLDREMVYTCAYFPTPDCSLEEAQIAKMDLVCRKLRLRPGERVVEAGCGWGALALFMARQYGVSVRRSTSRRSRLRSRASARSAKGSTDQVEFVEDDYRNVHGRVRRVRLGRHARARRPGGLSRSWARSSTARLTGDGRGLLHFIGRNQPDAAQSVDPAGASSPARTRRRCARCSSSARTAGLVRARRGESAAPLREDARTLAQRFDGAADQVRQMFDETFVRAWRLYLAGSRSGVHDRIDAAVPGRVRAGHEQRDSMDAS